MGHTGSKKRRVRKNPFSIKNINNISSLQLFFSFFYQIYVDFILIFMVKWNNSEKGGTGIC